MKRMKWAALAALSVFTLALSACTIERFRVGSTRTESETVEVGNAETVRADIRMGVGEIEISGGARELMEAEFAFNVDELEPQVSYDVSGTTGRLTVEHRRVEGFPLGEYENVRSEWDLIFNDDIPIDMTLSLGAALGDIHLRGMALNSLNLEVGAGDAELWLGDGPLRNLDIEVGAGKLTLDMVANWERDLDAEITGGVGKLTIYLPSDVGVIVDVQLGIVAIDARGLQKDGNTYTNDAYGESEVTLRLEIEGGIGDIRLEVRE
ncbi:MAG: hypothetical protein AMJ88_13985 [Anaerolineae bacterium SM23_ 63]|nr:MAG: hypothetical protein AMJ88_13985 [Anaerolineae bacterium SM23_ 63]HEY46345.1 hypothetical protein [Anaerolineae bacterium]